MEFQLRYFKSWKMMLWKCCTQYISKLGNSAVPQDWKGQFSFQSQRRAMPKNVQTTVQLCPFHMLARYAQNPSSPASIVWEAIPEVKAGFRKNRGTRDQIANICWSIEKAREFQKTSTSASLTTLKPLTVWNKLWKSLKEMGIPDHRICLLRNLYAGQEATEPNMK